MPLLIGGPANGRRVERSGDTYRVPHATGYHLYHRGELGIGHDRAAVYFHESLSDFNRDRRLITFLMADRDEAA